MPVSPQPALPQREGWELRKGLSAPSGKTGSGLLPSLPFASRKRKGTDWMFLFRNCHHLNGVLA
jgi:hypothetical protein